MIDLVKIFLFGNKISIQILPVYKGFGSEGGIIVRKTIEKEFANFNSPQYTCNNINITYFFYQLISRYYIEKYYVQAKFGFSTFDTETPTISMNSVFG